MSIIKQIIPLSLHAHPHYRSLASFVLIDVLLILISLISTPILLAIDFDFGAYIMGYISLSAVIYIIILWVTKNLDACSNYFAFNSIGMSLILMYYTGGVASPFVFWYFCVGPITYLYCKENVAFFWTSLTIILFLVLSAGHFFGYEYEQHLSPLVLHMFWSFNFLYASFVIISTLRNFQKGIKRINRKLHESNIKLTSSNKELERFAYIASHDLKSPVRSIISFISLFNKKYEHQFDNEGKEFLNIISSNAEQMHHLIEDILEFSKSNNRTARQEDIDLNIVMKEISSYHISKNKDAQIIFGHLPIIKSDYTIIKQVFQNLIENGLKYNDSYKKVVSVQFVEQKDSLYFRIKDNGIGMEEVYFERIFEMFQRLHNKDDYQGTGIGLAICKKSVEQLNGKLWVTSKVGEGSIFHVTLPKNNIITNLSEKDLMIEEEIIA